ncbi:MAG: hypothetical protein AAFR81_24965 [Chloroflexota bacterium]
MAIQVKTYIELRGDNPLDAVISGHHYKAYLVAHLAFEDGSEVSARHYNLTHAEVYGAMAFYEENRASILQAIDDASELGKTLGAKTLGE